MVLKHNSILPVKVKSFFFSDLLCGEASGGHPASPVSS